MSDPATRIWRGGRLLLLSVLALGATLVLGRVFAGFYTDLLWFRQSGYEGIFWARFWAEAATRLVVGGSAFFLGLWNFRRVGRSLGSVQIRRRFGDLEFAERIPRRTVAVGVVTASLFLGFWLATSFPGGAGLRVWLFVKAAAWGIEVPFYGKDPSFFVFALPLLEGGAVLGLSVTFLLFAFSLAGYAAAGAVRLRTRRPEMPAPVRRHLTVLLAIFCLFLAFRFWVSSYLLALEGHSAVQGIFGFADLQARLPALRILAGAAVAAGGLVVWGGWRNRWSFVLAAAIKLLVVGVASVQGYPRLIQRFQVRPNELAREAPFIEANIHFTRLGFGLERLRRERLPYSPDAPALWAEAARQLERLPLWNPPALLTIFRAMEARFPYYDFYGIAQDRYSSPAGPLTVALAVREIAPGGIVDPNWQNVHLRYVAGFGAVVVDAASVTPEGRPRMYISGIPPVRAEEGEAAGILEISRPAILFGSRPGPYAVVTPVGEPILSTPGTGPRADGSRDAQGAGFEDEGPIRAPQVQGIRLGRFLPRLLLAWRFGDLNLLLASELSAESLLLFRRSVMERASALAPFLRYLEPPYPVLHEGRVVWLLPAFTATRRFPLSRARPLPGGGWASYIRNSALVAVDAFTGEVQFYRLDVTDPLLEAWSRVFPGLLRPWEAMPEPLRAHVRYPVSLFDLQADVLLQYHQETPAEFHGQQDLWARPQELAEGSRLVPYSSEFSYFRLPGETDPEFLLTTVFVPAGRQNLTGILVARCDPMVYGDLILYEAPIAEQAPGPRQVEALVEQDPVISQQFSLWRQGGSQVWSGHLHVVPVGETLLYMEPIYLAAAADAIPELRRIVLSDGKRVAMEGSLEQALEVLARQTGTSGVESSELPPARLVSGRGTEDWSREALRLLEQAEERLRSGDWAGFGETLGRLRRLLQGLARGE